MGQAPPLRVMTSRDRRGWNGEPMIEGWIAVRQEADGSRIVIHLLVWDDALGGAR